MRKALPFDVALATLSALAVPAGSGCSFGPRYAQLALPPAADSAVRAAFVELGSYEWASSSACDVRFLAAASGEALVTHGREEQRLAPGDVLVVQGPGRIRASGKAVALVAAFSPERCDEAIAAGHRGWSIVRAGTAPELSWAAPSGGNMHAHLDVQDFKSPSVYFGRLSGDAAVAEHAHDGSREVLCAVQASGTLTLEGVAHHLGPRECAQVPPSVRHAYRPDPGTGIVAFQMYAPPGPEQRFKKLAALPLAVPAAR
jgi:mannose-6-phosphate isomerase-like protein (cupin superfamily)